MTTPTPDPVPPTPLPGPRLSEIGEDGLVDDIAHALNGTRHSSLLPFGDDAAATPSPPPGTVMVWTVDAMVEGTHFRWWNHPTLPVSPGQLGFRLVAANMSDLAAKGARPMGGLLTLGVPDVPAREARIFIGAVADALDHFGGALLGGDTVAAPMWTFSLAVVGTIPVGRRLPPRGGARPGQQLYMTGFPGESRAGLLLLEAGNRSTDASSLHVIGRHLRPSPRLDAGAALAAAFDDLAMMDISDGIAKDAQRMARLSGCTLAIAESQVPISQHLAAVMGDGALECALAGGEDFELLFATSAPPWAVEAALEGTGVAARPIGLVEKGPGRAEVVRPDGTRYQPASGFEHFGGPR